MVKSKENKSHSSKRNPDDRFNYARLTGITFELLALNLAIIAGGYYIDQWAAASVPWALITSVFLSVAATIYYLLTKFSS